MAVHFDLVILPLAAQKKSLFLQKPSLEVESMKRFFTLDVDEYIIENHNIFESEASDPSNRRRFRASPAGLSLVEALVVLSILSIAAAAVAPNLFAWRANMRLQSTINELLGELHSAKSLAAKHNTTVSVEFEPAESRYKITYVDSGGHPVALKREALPPELRIDSAHPDYTLDNHRLTFTSRGGASPGTLVVSHLGGKNKKIVISSIGKIRTGN